MPRAPRRCSKSGCDLLVPCPDHPPIDRRQGTTANGYGWSHQQRAAALRAESSAGGAPCSLCGGLIDYSLRSPHPWSFVAHHLTRDKLGPLAPAHRRCNERAGQPAPLGVTSSPRVQRT